MRLQTVDPKILAPEIFRVLGTQNALLTAGDREKCNTMTIGWGQMGELWALPVCTVYVRPERCTYEFMEDHDYFTVSVLPESARKTMAFCGSRSGRDVDKIKECGLTVRYGAGNAPFFDEAEWALVCRKLYVQDLSDVPVTESGREKILPYYGQKGGWHRAYTGEIVEAYSRR